MANENLRRTVAIVRAAAFVRVGKHKPGKIPRQAQPDHIKRDYTRAIAEFVSRKVIREAFAPLLAELPYLMESAKRERGDALVTGDAVSDELHRRARIDADEGKRARALIAQAKERLRSQINTRRIEELAERFANQTSTFQRVQMNRLTQSVLGADIFTGDRGLRAKIQGFMTENVGLIKNIPEEITIRVEKTVTRALTSATLHGDLAKQLEDEFGYGERRAAIIARDQIGKIYGQINAGRQKELGVSKFRWRTVGDERVRGDPSGKYPDADSSHYDWDGEVFSYDDPPRDEDGNPVLPGEPILCRCYAEPVLDEILDETEE